MEVYKLYWWEHNSPNGQYSSAKVHRLLEVKSTVDEPKRIEDYDISLRELDGLNCEIVEGE
jgi:CRISPR-associated protein Csd2